MHRRILTTVAGLVTALLLWAAPAQAITNGVIDTEHLNVGVMGVEFAPGQSFYPCTGTLIAPDVFLVAGHCVAGLEAFFRPDQIFVSFDINFFQVSTVVRALEFHHDPAFLTAKQSDNHDLAVIILSRDVTAWNGTPITPAELPTASLLDQLAAHGGLRDMSFENVGYGYSAFFKHGRPGAEIDGYRRFSTSPFMALTQAYLQQLMNSDATGEGGSCYIDSGSPKFIPDTDMIVAVQSQGDPHCRALSIAYRLDTPQARAFLGQFVELP
jgi:hypothetical protein